MDQAVPCVSAEVAARLGALRRLTGTAQDKLAVWLEIHPDTLGERERGTIALRYWDAQWQLQNIVGLWDGACDEFRRVVGVLRPVLQAGAAAERARADEKARRKWSRRKRVLVDAYHQEMLLPLRTLVGISRTDLARYLGVGEKVIWERETIRAMPAPSRLLAQLEALVELVESRDAFVAGEARALETVIADYANGRA